MQARDDGTESVDSEIEEAGEVQGAGVYAMRALRTPACGVQEVQDLPDLFQRLGESGSDTRRAQGQLVSGRTVRGEQRDVE